MTVILPIPGYSSAEIPQDEEQRLEELYDMEILDTSSDERFDRYTELAAQILNVPIALISLVDRDRQWFKSARGLTVKETPRNVSFCAHALNEPQGWLLVRDASADPRFAGNPLVAGDPAVRFYAGAVIHGPSGQPLGTCCVIDLQPRTLSSSEVFALQQIAKLIEQELQTRALLNDLRSKIQSHALYDMETGLPNQALFFTRLHALLKPPLPRDYVLALALIRLDHFDTAHAALGSAGAAFLISETASRLRDILGHNVQLGRIREDKIAATFPVSTAELAETMMGRLLQAMEEPFVVANHSIPVRVTIGAAVCPDDATDAQALLKRARTALYAEPASDRSSVRSYNPKLSDRAARRFEIESALRKALAAGEFQLVYQPKITTRGHSYVGAEALLRWNHSTLGEISPLEFVPIAESSGLSAELGNWVNRAACRQIALWRDQELDCLEISVNVTSMQIRQPGFCEQVRQILDETGLEGRHLNIEITEGSLIDDIDTAITLMQRLRNWGVSLSIDDFGTGFSSLSYLQRMPIQILKIDRSFVQRMEGPEKNRQLVHSIVQMAHALDLKVVAEGVETEQQLQQLRAFGCDQVQGYLFSRPLDAKHFARKYLERKSSG